MTMMESLKEMTEKMTAEGRLSFALDCADRAIAFKPELVDQRSTEALEVGRRYLSGDASQEDLEKAIELARVAARCAEQPGCYGARGAVANSVLYALESAESTRKAWSAAYAAAVIHFMTEPKYERRFVGSRAETAWQLEQAERYCVA